MVLAMFLNIEEYVDEQKKEKLLEMINMAEAYQGVIAEIRNEGKKSIISRLLKKYSVEEVSEILEMKSSEILNIINKVD